MNDTVTMTREQLVTLLEQAAQTAVKAVMAVKPIAVVAPVVSKCTTNWDLSVGKGDALVIRVPMLEGRDKLTVGGMAGRGKKRPIVSLIERGTSFSYRSDGTIDMTGKDYNLNMCITDNR